MTPGAAAGRIDGAMFPAEGETPLVRFADRRDAGRQLAAQLLPLAGKRPVVVGLPRGGIPVASEIAIALKAPLEILAVRKLGAPHNLEYGIGAIVEDGTRIFDPEALAALAVDGSTLESIVARASEELGRRVVAYRGGRQPMRLCNRTVVVVDDGVATGVTDTAAIRAIRRQQPRQLILAVPVCPLDSLARLRKEADETICLITPSRLKGVSEWYRDFSQIDDQEVIAALSAARRSVA
jgi:predicted phosphoribosyltransferase